MVHMCRVYAKCQIPRNEKPFLGEPDQRYCSFDFWVLTLICGSFAPRYHEGINLVLLDPDVRKAFRTERAVDDALCLVTELRKVGSYKRGDYGSNGAWGCVTRR
jgi:hypothetical protein